MTNFQLLKHLNNFSKPFRKNLIIVFVAIILITGIEAINTIFFSKIFDIIQIHSTDPTYLDDALILVGLASTCVFIRIIISRFQNNLEIKKIDVAIPNHLNHTSISKYFQFSNGQHINEHSGIKQNIITSGYTSMQNQLNMLIYNFVPNLSQLIISIIILFSIHYIFGIAYLLIGTIFGLIMWKFNNYLEPKIRIVRDCSNQTAKTISELYRLVFLIKNEVAESKSLKNLDKVQDDFQNAYKNTWLKASDLMTGIRFFNSFFRYATLFLGVWLLFSGWISAGSIFLLLNWSSNFLGSVWAITDMQKQFVTNKINIEKYFELLDVKPDIIIKDGAPKEDLVGDIEFKEVHFKYPKRDESESASPMILKGISFKINRGEKIAFVGESGSGKSTIANLIRRAFDPQSGDILTNNLNLKDIDLNSFLKKIGSVDQDVQLFDRSIKENIEFGAGKPLSDEELSKIAKMSRLDKFYQKLEGGWETTVGERGLKISGGEKQRIGIARAMAKNPEILIFDEATSALDTISERIVHKAIDEVSKGKTSIIIAHRLSTVKNCDKIFVLKEGEIVGEGTHEHLLENCEYYKQLVKDQLQKNTKSE
jgi:ABC-type multidrug transport system fused ATPase/permease subunit